MIGGILQTQCCCPGGPFPSLCDPPTAASYVRLTTRQQFAEAYAFDYEQIGTCGSTVVPSCSPTVPTPSPDYSTCTSSGQKTYDGDLDFTRDQTSNRSESMPTDIVYDLYWNRSFDQISSGLWVEPTGIITSLVVSTVSRVDVYESLVAQTNFFNYGPCGSGCTQYTLEPSCGTWLASARFTNWPFHSAGPGPMAFSIRRRSGGGAIATRWDVVGGVFRLKTSTTVLWTLTLSGLTLEQARNQIDTQTVAPVRCLWNYTFGVSAATENLPATYLEDQPDNPSFTQVPSATSTPNTIYLWRLPVGETRLCSDIAFGNCVPPCTNPSGNCPERPASHNCGWISVIGGFLLWEPADLYGRRYRGFSDGINDCGYTTYADVCQGAAIRSLAGAYVSTFATDLPPGTGCSVLGTRGVSAVVCGSGYYSQNTGGCDSYSLTESCPQIDVAGYDCSTTPNNCNPQVPVIAEGFSSYKPLPLGQAPFDCAGPVDVTIFGPASGTGSFECCLDVEPGIGLGSFCWWSAEASQVKVYDFAEIRRMA